MKVTVWPGLASAGENLASTFFTAFSYHFCGGGRWRQRARQQDTRTSADTSDPFMPDDSGFDSLVAHFFASAGGLRPSMRQRLHRLRREVDDADAVGVGVGDVQLAGRVADAARLVEQRRREPAPVVAAQERRHSLVFGSKTLILLL